MKQTVIFLLTLLALFLVACTPTETEEEPERELFFDECTLPEGLVCFDYKVKNDSIRLTLSSTLHTEINAIYIDSEHCDEVLHSGMKPGSAVEFELSNCGFEGETIEEKLFFKYTNKDTKEVVNAEGFLKTRVR